MERAVKGALAEARTDEMKAVAEAPGKVLDQFAVE